MDKALEIFASRFTPPGFDAGGAEGSVPSICIPSLTGSADAFLAATLAWRRRREDTANLVVAITPGIPDAERLADDLRLIADRQGEAESLPLLNKDDKNSTNSRGKDSSAPLRVLELPPLLTEDRSALGLRLKTIAAVRAWEMNPYPCVVVASYPALTTPIPKGTVSGITLNTKSNQGARNKEQLGNSHSSSSDHSSPLTFHSLCARLAEIGYSRVPQVTDVGEYSVRGGIVDAWGPGEEFPVRAEFFGEDLESLRQFDSATQISITRVDEAVLLPVAEKEVEKEGGGGERNSSNLLDILPKGSTVLALEHNEYNLPLSTSTSSLHLLFTGEPAPQGVAVYPFLTAPLPGFAELGADEAHHPELFDAARKRLDQHIAAAEQRGETICRIDDLSGGFEIGEAESLPLQNKDGKNSTISRGKDSSAPPPQNLLVVTKADRVFTKRKATTRRTAAGAGARLNDFDELEPGEYVVHVDHGIGRFLGSSEILVDGKRSEVFTIEYADGAKLHVPAAHAHLLSRYVGVKGEAVKLHRLDGARWQKDKADAQKAVADLAVALLETQAKREVVPGFAYDVHCEGREAFDAAFPYEETPDQLAAIAAIEKDMASTKPMDRLICGDAGYGKTEVAMRAAYIAAMNGKQVAVLAPTTVLAEQHFETFTARFDGTPVRIESMSRFQSAATHNGTFQRIATGVCDIVIGTHAILSSKMAFRDLGLIIIDEEQRFGVRHKEFLKALRATADVLTLSATPIPRTLYLSMTGARDLSLLRSPPRERVAVDTKIVTDSDQIVKAAIEAELARGGQVFFLHNRVTTIGKVEKRLMALFEQSKSEVEVEQRNVKKSTVRLGPSTSTSAIRGKPRIVVAHGQMDTRVLAKKMREFERGDYDILLSTTIVESGIDIPRANTILVDQAHMFGLADLYQLRGRVGRSSKQGHAVFLLPSAGLVDSDARERLNALKRHGGLGSGFNLAVRDLELRGAGNLLGSQQSGHIAAVGFGLYCQLLQRTISALKGEKLKEIVDVKLNLDFIDWSPASEDDESSAALPYSYVEEDVQRISLIKRFAEAMDARIVKALAKEMEDRFGPLPKAAQRMVRLALLRVKAAQAGIGIIDVKDKRAVLYRNGSRDIVKVLDLRGKNADRKIYELMNQL